MSRRNFIDWNGSGNLDPQDLVTGVAMDTVEQEEEHEQRASKTPPPGASGCMLNTFLLAFIVLIATIAASVV
jgi:hypothetical protein